MLFVSATLLSDDSLLDMKEINKLCFLISLSLQLHVINTYLGVGMATRKMGNLAKPKVTVTINGNSLNLKSESTFRNLETSCTLGEEFDETTPDGRKCKVN